MQTFLRGSERNRSRSWPTARTGVLVITAIMGSVAATAWAPPAPPTETAPDREVLVGLSAPSQDAALAVDFDARVRDLLIREGQPVTAGAPLIRFEDEAHRLRAEIAQFEASSTLHLELAQVRVRHAESELARIEGLGSTTSTKELLDARLAAEAARLEHSIAQLKHAQAARQHRLEQELLQQRTLTAPFEGVVVQIAPEVGETVERGAEIMRLVKLHPLRVTFNCPIEIAHEMTRGQPVQLRATLPGASQRVGHIDFISPVVDPASQMVMVRVSVGNDSRDWPAGVRVEMDVPGPAPAPAVATSVGSHAPKGD